MGEERKVMIGLTSAEAVVGNVNLLENILLGVPAKSLIRFKCVCKPWLSCISDPNFCRKQASRNRNSLISGLFFYLTSGELKTVSLHGIKGVPTIAFFNGVGAELGGEAGEITIEHSCNGLLLCSKGKHLIVCNATSQNYKLLPPKPDMHFPIYLNSSHYLTFDPLISPHYKVVGFNRVPDIEEYRQVDIFSSESDSWDYHFYKRDLDLPIRPVFFLNGALNWFSEQKKYVGIDVEKGIVMEGLAGMPFTNVMPPNLGNLTDDIPSIPEKVDFLPYFTPPNPENRSWYFAERGGQFFLVQIDRRSAMGFTVMVMDVKLNWHFQDYVYHGPLISAFPEILQNGSCIYSVLSMVNGEHENDIELLLAIPAKVVSYNLMSKIVKEVCDLQPGDIELVENYTTGAHHFIESLSPV